MISDDTLGTIEFSGDGEDWIEFGPPEARRRVGFHDYAAMYAVPGLYERAMYEELGMSTASEIPRLFGRTLDELGLAPAEQRVLDFGAGNGVSGERIREVGVGHLVGLDIEPMARVAALRDRPEVYDAYLVGDLTGDASPVVDELAGHDFTAMLAVAAVGIGHVPPPALERAMGLVEPGGLFAFAVTPALLPGSTDAEGLGTGYPGYLAQVFETHTILARHEYVHRQQTDGTPHHAHAIVGRVSDPAGYASSAWRSLIRPSSWAITPGSRRVVTSPSSRPSAMSRSSRRMILPLRVLGRSPAQMILLGRANLPMRAATRSRISSTSASEPSSSVPSSVTNAHTDCPVSSSACPMTAHSATFGCETTADSISAVLRRWPETLITSSMRPMTQK